MLSAAGLVIVIAGLKVAEPFLVPVVTGVMVAAVSSPLLTWLVRKGAPAMLGATLVLILDVAVLGGVARLLLLAASDLQDRLPHYVDQLSAFSHAIEHYLNRRGLHQVADATKMQSDQTGELLQALVGNFASLTAHASVVIFVVFFALCEIGGMGEKLRLLVRDADAQFERVDRIVRQVQLYVLVKLCTSLLAALCAFAVLKVAGVSLALLLALLLFLLHFVPNIGTAIATLPAVALALADRGPATALSVALAYLIINLVVGNLIEPRMLGARLGVSPFVVLLGMLFWGWLWGPIGALLAVPLLVACKIVLENVPAWAWLGVLTDSSASHAHEALRVEAGPVLAGFGLGKDPRPTAARGERLTEPGFRRPIEPRR